MNGAGLGGGGAGPATAPGSSLIERLQRLGSQRYHHRHPFNLLMHAGKLTQDELRSWVANRYYYQTRIPIKDALILAKSEDSAFRRAWAQRLADQDGPPGTEQDGDGEPASGLALWRRLAEACGVAAADLDAHRLLLPRVRRACDEYVDLVRGADLVTAVASSLTEYFAGDIMRVRLEAWTRHYPWVVPEALRYFELRIRQARADSRFGLAFVEAHAITEEQQERCLRAFEAKCTILWDMLDAIYVACRRGQTPRLAPRAGLGEPEPHGEDGEDGEDGGCLLLPERGLSLNGTARAVLERCDGTRTVEELAAELATQHGAPPDRVLHDLATFLGEMERQRVLVFEGARQ